MIKPWALASAEIFFSYSCDEINYDLNSDFFWKRVTSLLVIGLNHYQFFMNIAGCCIVFLYNKWDESLVGPTYDLCDLDVEFHQDLTGPSDHPTTPERSCSSIISPAQPRIVVRWSETPDWWHFREG